MILYVLYGMRQGFFKEMISIVSFFLAFYFASLGYEPAGELLSRQTGIPTIIAYPVAALGCWILIYFVLVLTGRLLWKMLRHSPTEAADEAAEEVADEVTGEDTEPGPITLLTDPILPTKKGVLYWLDKSLGGLLGLTKGALTVSLVLFAGTHVFPGSWLDKNLQGTAAHALYAAVIDPALQTIPEFRLAAQTAELKSLAEVAKQDPEKARRLFDHPEVKALAEHPAIRELAEDEGIQTAFKEGDYVTLLKSSKVKELLADREFRKQLADIDWEELRKELESEKETSTPPSDSPDSEASSSD